MDDPLSDEFLLFFSQQTTVACCSDCWRLYFTRRREASWIGVIQSEVLFVELAVCGFKLCVLCIRLMRCKVMPRHWMTCGQRNLRFSVGFPSLGNFDADLVALLVADLRCRRIKCSRDRLV
jgi:hypothetical protein